LPSFLEALKELLAGASVIEETVRNGKRVQRLFGRHVLLKSALLLLIGAALNAGTITTGVTCEADGSGSATAINMCAEGQSPNVFATATSSAVAFIENPPELFVNINQSVNTGLSDAPLLPTQAPAVATAVAAINLSLDTPGPVRAGFVSIDLLEANLQGSFENFLGTFGFQLGSIGGNCQGDSGTCTANYSSSLSSKVLQFTLGTPFVFTAQGHLGAYAAEEGGAGAGSSAFAADFVFYEADGKTLVPLIDVGTPAPEPSWLWLAGLPLLFVLRKR
jgi:hypothetical protein